MSKTVRGASFVFLCSETPWRSLVKTGDELVCPVWATGWGPMEPRCFGNVCDQGFAKTLEFLKTGEY